MSRRFLPFLLIAAAPLFAQQAPQNQTFGEKVNVDLVQLDAIVTDARGNQILGLGKDDFVVRENGVEQKIDAVDYFTNRRLLNAPEGNANFSVERVHEDRYLILFFDKPLPNPATQGEIVRARTDALRFINESLGPQERVAVVGHDVRLKIYSDFTNDKQQLRRALDEATQFGLGIRSKEAASGGVSLVRNLDFGRVIDRTGTVYEALDVLGDALRPIRGRKELVLFSYGINAGDEDVQGGMILSRSRYYDPAIASLNSADVSVYAVSMGDADVSSSAHQSLSMLSNDTKGEFFPFHASFLTPLRQVEKKAAGYYLISYASTTHPKGFQKVDVSLRNPEFRVSARPGYSLNE